MSAVMSNTDPKPTFREACTARPLASDFSPLYGNFTPEEWTKVLESTMVAGIAVSAAEPSGLRLNRLSASPNRGC